MSDQSSANIAAHKFLVSHRSIMIIEAHLKHRQVDIPGYSRIFQGYSRDIPGYPRVSQDTPGYARISQDMPGYARIC